MVDLALVIVVYFAGLMVGFAAGKPGISPVQASLWTAGVLIATAAMGVLSFRLAN